MTPAIPVATTVAEGALHMNVDLEGQKLVAPGQTAATGVSAATGASAAVMTDWTFGGRGRLSRAGLRPPMGGCTTSTRGRGMAARPGGGTGTQPGALLT